MEVVKRKTKWCVCYWNTSSDRTPTDLEEARGGTIYLRSGPDLDLPARLVAIGSALDDDGHGGDFTGRVDRHSNAAAHSDGLTSSQLHATFQSARLELALIYPKLDVMMAPLLNRRNVSFFHRKVSFITARTSVLDIFPFSI